MKLDWFMLSVIDVRIPDESDEAARIRGAIVDEAASFLEAGSLTLEDWRSLAPESRAAFVIAARRLGRRGPVDATPAPCEDPSAVAEATLRAAVLSARGGIEAP